VQYKDPKSSVAEAFNKAEQLCGIPQLLNVEDMTEVKEANTGTPELFFLLSDFPGC
jgi:hypothetical protein